MNPSAVRKEDRLLLCCARTTIDPEADSEIRCLLQGEIDWKYFVDQAVHHRVVPLVWHTILKSRIPLPSYVCEELQLQSNAIARRSLYLAFELIRVLQLLERNGIRVISYKGPTGALAIYGNLSLRQFGDLDILVHPRDYEKSRAYMLMNGFCLTADWGWECSLQDTSGRVSVDLHKSIAPDIFSMSLDFDRLWTHAKKVALGDKRVMTFRLEDMLTVLCVQLAKDSWGEGALRLSKICDVSELIRRHPELDWEEVLAQTRETGCRRILWLAIALAQDLLGAPKSDSVPEIPSSERLSSLKDFVVSRIFDSGSAVVNGRLSREDFHFDVRERWRDKLYPHYSSIKRGLAPNERDFTFLSLPDRVKWLYYVVKPARLMRDSVASMFRNSP